MTHRFSKSLTLRVLDLKARRIADAQNFNLSSGTSQLNPKAREFEEMIARAVEYGRMRALEEFACSIEEGFAFDDVENEE